MFLHCATCIKEKPKTISMENYARLSVSINEDGLQIFCVRHNMSVVRLDPVTLLDFMEHTPSCQQCQEGIPHKH